MRNCVDTFARTAPGAVGARLVTVFVVHATRKLLDRVGGPTGPIAGQVPSTFGTWYATVVFWRPQVALFVNEATLLPVLMPLAPAATVLNRFPEALVGTLGAHGVDEAFIGCEVGAMTERHVAKTTNRSVVGIMNEFSYLGGVYREAPGPVDLIGLALRLAATPCSPLYATTVSPDRALAAHAAMHHCS